MDLAQEVIGDLSRGQVPSMDVLTLLATRIIGYCITFGAAFIKIPQIMAILKSKSVEGLSILSFELEMFITAIHTSYGYILELDFSAYGEAVVMFFQCFVLVACIYWYGQLSKARSAMMYTLLAIGGGLVYLDNVSESQIGMIYVMNQGFFIVARGAQILKNYQQGGTGQLSLASSVLPFLGCIARIFTTIREGAGLTFLVGFILGTVLNGIVVLQILYYQGKKEKVVKKD
ncbi:hypothetical protein BSKO_04881 [Bryopsis sp. KO-2023]|nr:hypothetical protein BSKO_04881 [Bryopsis sp. KO-2023]